MITIYHTHFISYVKYYLRNFKILIPLFSRLIKERAFEVYSKPDMVLVPTREIMRELKKDCGLDGNNLVLWQRGLNSEMFTPSKKNRFYVQGITKNMKPVILFASRLVWEKNLTLLIDIYQLSRQKGDKLNFIIAGDGQARKELQKQMSGAIFLGAVDHAELSRLYASSDVFLFPSDTESYGNVLIEAMASGCPSVASEVGGHTDFVKHEKNALLCSPDDAAGFLSAVHRLLNEKELRERIIQNGIEFSHSLKWNPLVDKYFDHLVALKSQKSVVYSDDYMLALG